MERIFHGASREGAKLAKFGAIGRYISLRPFGFAQDRLGTKNFLEVVRLNILSVRIYQSDAERPDLAFTLEAEDLGARFR